LKNGAAANPDEYTFSESAAPSAFLLE